MVISGELCSQQLDWAVPISSTNAGILDFDVDFAGNIVSVGQFLGTVDLDPGPSASNHTCGVIYGCGFVVKLDSIGNFIWGATWQGDSGVAMSSIDVSEDGIVYLLGGASGTMDMDPGIGVDSMSHGFRGGFLIRLDSNGQYENAASISNIDPGTGGGKDLIVDNTDNLYISGIFYDDADFDPGPNTLSYPPGGGQNGFLAKYDTAFQLKWVVPLRSGDQDLQQSIALDPTGIYCTGRTIGTMDVDPSLNVTLINQGLDACGYLLKYSYAGSLLWVREIIQPTFPRDINPLALTVGPTGVLTMVGDFLESIDLDPGPAVDWRISHGGWDNFILQFDTMGNYLRGGAMGGPHDDQLVDATTDQEGAVYLSLLFYDSTDVDPGLGIMRVISDSSTGCLVKLDSAGQLNWAGKVEGAGLEYIVRSHVDTMQRILLVGLFNGNADFDPSALDTFALSQATTSGFIARWHQGVCNSFGLQIDSVRSLSCTMSLGYASGHGVNGDPPYAYAWNTMPVTIDSFISPSQAGVYTLSVTDQLGCSTNRAVLVDGSHFSSGFDLYGVLRGFLFQPSVTTTLAFDILNGGCFAAVGTVQVILDSRLSMVQSTPLADSVHGDTLYFTTASLVYNGPPFSIFIDILTDSLVQLSDTMDLEMIVSPSLGDMDTSNNRMDYRLPASASMDPNWIQVYPVGTCVERYVVQEEPLIYTIHFQNTGNAPAIDIAIIDTISRYLLPSSIQVLGQTHPIITEFLSDSVIRFRFDNIFLPDSASDPMGSQGYVCFKIQPDTTSIPPFELSNSAAIYFDFNPPIITNLVSNSIVDAIPVCSVERQEMSENEGVELLIYPNPATDQLHLKSDAILTDLMVLNSFGQLQWVADRFLPTPQTIDVNNWPRGLYVLSFQHGKERMSVRFLLL